MNLTAPLTIISAHQRALHEGRGCLLLKPLQTPGDWRLERQPAFHGLSDATELSSAACWALRSARKGGRRRGTDCHCLLLLPCGAM